MAFSFASVAAGSGVGAGEGLRVQDGQELQEIQTDQIGFQAINGETRLRLLSKPWSTDDLPIPSASLMSVASSQGLLAAAGPDALIIATTESVRQALQGAGEENVREISPILSIPHTRLSHVAFSADESVLVVSEQGHGGIVAYRVDKLKQGEARPALQLSTNNVGLRALIPNPAIPSAQYFAAITMNGELLLADLGVGQIQKGPNNDTVLMNNISCIAWSNKGKQLAAGLADGTAVQLKPDGSIVTRLPKSTSVSENVHVSAISWLENDSFMIIYTPNTTSTDEGIPASEYFIVTRDKESYTFQKLPEILPPFGVERVPTHHFISRLRSWKPHLDDLIILSATTATDVGIISKADNPLSSAEPVVNAFTSTTIDNDTRRAALPLSIEDSLDTSPIGMAIDLSSTQTIPRPIPTDEEILETSGSVPNLLVLNNEGMLCSWWVIYNDSVRVKTIFSGFANLTAMEEARTAVSQSVKTGDEQAHTPAAIPSPQTSSDTASPFVKPSTTSGSTFKQPTFGTGSTFGTASKIGENKGSWTSTGFGNAAVSPAKDSAFGKPGLGQPAFGAPSAPGGSNAPAFGATGSLGSRPSPFNSTSSAAPAFGQTTFGTKAASSNVFGSTTTASPFASTSGASGFASFSGGSGFAALNDKTSKESPFAKASGGSAFGQPSESPFPKAGSNNAFHKPSGPSPFARPQSLGTTTSQSNPVFGSTNSFKLGSTFKGDGSAKDDLPKPIGTAGFGFGSGFGDLLSESKPIVSPTRDTEAEMEDKSDAQSEHTEAKDISFSGLSSDPPKGRSEGDKSLVTPPSTISQSKATPAQPVANLFGPAPDQHKTPEPLVGGWSFGKNASTTPKDTPAPSKTLFGTQSISGFTPADIQKSEPVNAFSSIAEVKTPETKSKLERESGPQITTESPSDDEVTGAKKVSEPPLPPDITSKPGYQTGDTSASSINSSKPDEAPLPPDFLATSKSATANVETEIPLQEDENDDDGYSSDFGDSGEDVTHDISPANGSDSQHDQQEEVEDLDDDQEITDQIDTSPESLHKADHTTNPVESPTGGLFTKVTVNQPIKSTRPLFGEVGGTAPVFPPPKPQQSPRSPSPIRQLMPHDSLRTELRSVSAPARPRSAIDQRKAEYSQSAIAAQAARAREEELNKERVRLDAIKQAQELARAEEMKFLEDDEDERIQKELAEPISPSETLDAFITYEAASEILTGKVDIPSQIERLYQDINSMIYTLGINARSLASFIAYQKARPPNQSWPAVLRSTTPLDAMNDEWFLEDIELLHGGSSVLEKSLEQSSQEPIQQRLEICQGPLSQDLHDLKAKVKALRKTVSTRMQDTGSIAPLSAEQASIQHDLRKSSADVQTKLVMVEDNLTMLRARLADVARPEPSNNGNSAFRSAQTKKPTVEAVSNTVAKMTSMAEKKSADVDVLEAQLKRMGLAGQVAASEKVTQPSTPRRNGLSWTTSTPDSATSSIYHTPGSHLTRSQRGTASIGGSARKSNGIGMVSLDDRQRWQAKARRRRDVAAALKSVLEEKRAKLGASA